MPLQPDPPFPKVRGNAIRAKDWNDAVNEVVRLDQTKLNQSGGTVTGNLAVTGNISGNLAAGIVGTSQIAANAVTADKIPLNAIAVDKFVGRYFHRNVSVSISGSSKLYVSLSYDQVAQGGVFRPGSAVCPLVFLSIVPEPFSPVDATLSYAFQYRVSLGAGGEPFGMHVMELTSTSGRYEVHLNVYDFYSS